VLKRYFIYSGVVELVALEMKFNFGGQLLKWDSLEGMNGIIGWKFIRNPFHQGDEE